MDIFESILWRHSRLWTKLGLEMERAISPEGDGTLATLFFEKVGWCNELLAEMDAIVAKDVFVSRRVALQFLSGTTDLMDTLNYVRKVAISRMSRFSMEATERDYAAFATFLDDIELASLRVFAQASAAVAVLRRL